jgi:hypothetical protein
MSLKDIHSYFRKVGLEQHSNLVGINLVSSTTHWFILRNFFLFYRFYIYSHVYTLFGLPYNAAPHTNTPFPLPPSG